MTLFVEIQLTEAVMSNYRCRYIRSEGKAFHLCHLIVGCFTSIKSKKILVFDLRCVVCCMIKIHAALRLLKQVLFKLWRQENMGKHEFQRIKDWLSSSTQTLKPNSMLVRYEKSCQSCALCCDVRPG